MQAQILLYEQYMAILPEPISLNRRIEQLRYIGPYLSQRANEQGIIKLRDFKQAFERRDNESVAQRKRKNTRLMERIFENANPRQCVGEIVNNNRRYAVRTYNKYGWNSLLYYLYQKIVAGNIQNLEIATLPDFQVHIRPNYIALPRRCAA